jgi:hypothetical protein
MQESLWKFGFIALVEITTTILSCSLFYTVATALEVVSPMPTSQVAILIALAAANSVVSPAIKWLVDLCFSECARWCFATTAQEGGRYQQIEQEEEVEQKD